MHRCVKALRGGGTRIPLVTTATVTIGWAIDRVTDIFDPDDLQMTSRASQTCHNLEVDNPRVYQQGSSYISSIIITVVKPYHCFNSFIIWPFYLIMSHIWHPR